MKKKKTFFLIPLLLTVFLINAITVNGQEKVANKKYILNGYVRDENGEELIGVNLWFPGPGKGCVSNEYGFYSITLPAGRVVLKVSYIGYTTLTDTVELNKNTRHDFIMHVSSREIKDVEVHAGKDALMTTGRFQAVTLPMKIIESTPSLMGESDLIKTIQLLPGVLAANEGVSNFNVRGGNFDQNLILLDEATVFNPSHLMGFFSVFNPDVVKDVRLYKGNLPATNGGRLSSVLDVRMREGSRDRLSLRGGIGNIASRLMVESPLFNHKGSFLIAGRRSYADLFLPLSKNEEINQNRIYFYDLNFKTNLTINKRNRIFLSGYSGRDDFTYRKDYYMSWGNYTTTLRWNHLFTQNLFSNLSLIYSRYNYRLGQTTELTGVEWRSFMDNFQGKYDFTWYPAPGNTFRFGVSSSYFHFSPGAIQAKDTLSVFNNYAIPGSNVWDNALYIENELQIGSNITLETGLRGSLFMNVGRATVYRYDEQYQVIDSVVYGRGKIFHTWPSLEPRAGITWQADSLLRIYGSYGYNRQFLHLISNTTTGTPLDIWIPSDPNIRPQYAHQFTAGISRDLGAHYTVSLEAYYKFLGGQIDYKEHANIILNPELTGELRFGVAHARGLEFMARKNTGKLKGWVSYTWSRVIREVPEINSGKPYPAPYDRPHNISLAGIYTLSPRISVSFTWLYQSGSPITFPVGRFVFDNIVVPVFSERNAYRLPDYHRLDLSLTLKTPPEKRKRFRSEWDFSVYNVYNRKNAWMVYFQANKENPQVTEAYKLYMFPIIPSITWNFFY